MMKILYQGVEEVIGEDLFGTFENSSEPNGLPPDSKNIQDLNRRFTLGELIPIQHYLKEQFGIRGALGIATRTGEACFRYFLRELGDQYQLTNNAYRLQNTLKRIPFGLNKLAAFCTDHCGFTITISEDENNWFWMISETRFRSGWTDLWGALFQGIVHEFLSWTSGGRSYVIYLESNDLPGDYLSQLRILKTPLAN